MQFSSLEAFFFMGGYGFYIWSAYGLTFLILLALVIEPVIKKRSLLKSLERREASALRMKNAQSLKNGL